MKTIKTTVKEARQDLKRSIFGDGFEVNGFEVNDLSDITELSILS